MRGKDGGNGVRGVRGLGSEQTSGSEVRDNCPDRGL